MKFGYVRVSTKHQSYERQDDVREMVEKAGKDGRLFEEKCTGTARHRPELGKMIEQLRPGDEVVCHSIDRLARNLEHMLEIAKEIRDKGATLHIMKGGIVIGPDDVMDPMQKMVFHMFAIFAEFEVDINKERREEARKRGRKPGRKTALSEGEQRDVYIKNQRGVTIAYLAREYGLSRRTIKRYIDDIKALAR